MMAKKVKTLSPDIQEWMEDQVWNIYKEAKRIDMNPRQTTCNQSIQYQPHTQHPINTQILHQQHTTNTYDQVQTPHILDDSFKYMQYQPNILALDHRYNANI